MDAALHINLYDLKVRIHCPRREDRRDIAGLLSLFLQDETEEVDVTLDFRRKRTPQEVGALLFPHLAGRGIWAMHSGGFHFHGGHLAVGPSDCGKSTFSYMAMKNGFPLLSDDITLLREFPGGIEILPLYSSLYLRDRVVVPDRWRFKPAVLRCLLLPRSNSGSITFRKVKRRMDVLRRLVPQFLWSYKRSEQKKQRAFLERMCGYPAYEVYWSYGLFHDDKRFREMLDEIVQSEG
jgi:hypothetical protein